MPTRDPRVDAYIAKSPAFAKPILEHVRAVVHEGCPECVETLKWSVPHFDYHGPIAGMAAFKAHCNFVLWRGPSLLETRPDREAMMQKLRGIVSVKDLPPKKTLVAWVKESADLNASGVKRPRTATRKAPIETPAALVAALKKKPKAKQAFDAFSPSHQREYAEWIAQAKTDDTRDRRIAQAVEWILEGKSRNWKYATKK